MSSTVPIEVDRRALLRAPAPAPETPGGERHLRLAQPAARPRKRPGLTPLAGSLAAVGVVLVILAVQLGLSIAVSQGAYEARALEIEQRDLGRVERVLSQNVDKLASPQNLAENAAALGMVQNAPPATMRLSDGAILGKLAASTTEAPGNLVPNATLESMPVVDAKGLLVDRDAAAAGAAGASAQKASTEAPVRWKGKLPAPNTH
ncbi:hypothetical protein D3248_09900 [Leucobacter zeae]|nr:hypothetical protein [Leucobacter zeae]